jgi:hypothetical protein
MSETQSAAAVLMVRPHRFASNPQTQACNAFQREVGGDVHAAAVAEFDALAAALRLAGVAVVAVEDSAEPQTPDAVFPNNWFSTHADGTVVLYPMCAENRRAERRLEVFAELRERGFGCNRLVDLSAHEIDGRFLEGTGSLVLDRVTRTAFACLSPRTHPAMLELWGEELGYRTFAFEARDAAGKPVYHTNVMLAIGSGWAVVCADSVTPPARRGELLAALAVGGRQVIAIDLEQMASFAGNILELRDASGRPVIAMSAQARAALRPDQIEALSVHGRIVASAVPTIETAGGGSVRCMIAEVFLPAAGSSRTRAEA